MGNSWDLCSPPQSSTLKIRAVQRPVLHRLRDVRRLDPIARREVRDGAGHLEDAVVGAGGEAEAFDGGEEEAFGRGVELAVFAELAGGHVRVGFAETVALDLASRFHARSDG